MPDDAPEEFLAAVRGLRAVRLRPEVVLEEVPAPQRIAPFALALSAEVVLDGEELATGRFVLLHAVRRPRRSGRGPPAGLGGVAVHGGRPATAARRRRPARPAPLSPDRSCAGAAPLSPDRSRVARRR